ncbi:hypothetical protein BS78_K262500 [Paspalum vaginatum]|uniref:Uncharacterized protein n=1 Tax=Paspalum vaginatum TaxID=158149 RepID=A0A9W7XE70_9POAL|nr:hypothetical protein BS78_K262500 [Paspalum vaginatum]
MLNIEQDFHTVEREGEYSYTKNSRRQEMILLESIPMLENAIRKVLETLVVKTMTIADLGCSSGPNTLLFVSSLIDITTEQCSKDVECDPMELMIFLNDRPNNDFNQVFRSLENLKKGTSDQKRNTPLFYHISGLPKSYYKRLLPRESVHLFHSSSSLHWRSQCYREQFNKDFSTFLKLRHEELVYGGKMVLTFGGRKDEDVYNGELNKFFDLLAMSLRSLVTKGLVEREKLDSFNVPFYGPSIAEVKEIVVQSHMFELDHIKLFETNWDPYDDTEGDDVHDSARSGINVSKFTRAGLGPLIAGHFGETILDALFTEYPCFVSKHLEKEKTKFAIIAMSLTKV